MNRLAMALPILIAAVLTTHDAFGGERDDQQDEGDQCWSNVLEASAAGDCHLMIQRLSEFLENHGDHREKYPVFFSKLAAQTEACRAALVQPKPYLLTSTVELAEVVSDAPTIKFPEYDTSRSVKMKTFKDSYVPPSLDEYFQVPRPRIPLKAKETPGGWRIEGNLNREGTYPLASTPETGTYRVQ